MRRVRREYAEGPTVQVSDLQTMAGLLVDANKTDDVDVPTVIRRVEKGAAAG